MRTMYQSIIRYLDEREGWRSDCWDDDPPEPDDEMGEEQIHVMLSRWDELPCDRM